MNFRIGQKVVCVDDTSRIVGGGLIHEADRVRRLFAGRIYEIAGIAPDGGVFLAGITRTLIGPGFGYYYADRFRPVAERKTDISIFTRMTKLRELEHL